MKKCLYCSGEIPQDSVIDFCERCGLGVFGRKMFDAIKQNMEDARSNNNLFQGNMINEMPEKENSIDKFR